MINKEDTTLDCANEEPLISVIMAVYNGEEYLRSSLDSILSQTYPNLEVIVVNDGSTDSSATILVSYGNKIRIINQSNSGQGIARNRGAEVAKGYYFAFLDSDDVWDRDKLVCQVALFSKFPEAVGVYCDYRRIDQNGDTMGRTAALWSPRASGQILKFLILGNLIGPPGVVMVTKKRFLEAGGFGEQVSRNGEDYALWLTLATLGPIIYSPETLVSYRVHDSQVSNQSNINFNKALGGVSAFDRASKLIEEKGSAQIKTLFKQHHWEKMISLGWNASQIRATRISLKSYLHAFRLKPWKFKALEGVVMTLVKQGLLQRLN